MSVIENRLRFLIGSNVRLSLTKQGAQLSEKRISELIDYEMGDFIEKIYNFIKDREK